MVDPVQSSESTTQVPVTPTRVIIIYPTSPAHIRPSPEIPKHTTNLIDPDSENLVLFQYPLQPQQKRTNHFSYMPEKTSNSVIKPIIGEYQ